MPTREEMIRALRQGSEGPSRQQMIEALRGKPKEEPSRTIEEKMPEGLAWGRFLTKNLGTDPLSSIKYLKQQYPQHEFDVENGEIIAKKTGDNTWGKLDPSSLELQDISDVGYDILSGIGSGAATALGGLAGGIPGAIGAGALSSGALEAGRQGLGQLAGVSDKMDTGSLVMSTGLGALSPVLFGTGATAKGAAASLAKNPKKLADILYKAGQSELMEKAPKEAMELGTQTLMQSQKGISRLFPTTGEFASGIQRETISNLAEEAPELVKKELKLQGPLTNVQAIDALKYQNKADLRIAEAMQKEIRNAVQGKEEGLSRAYDLVKEQADEEGKSVNVSGAVKILKSKINELLNVPEGEMPSRAAKRTAQRLNKIINGILTREVQVGTDDAGKAILERLPYSEVTLTEGKLIESRLGDALKKVSDDPDKFISRGLGAAVDHVSNKNDEIIGEYAPELVAQYRDWFKPDGKKAKIESIIKTPEKLDQVLRTTSADTKRVLNQTLQDIDATAGTKFNDYMKFMDTKAMFQRPSWTPVTVKGTTSTTRTLTASALAKAMGNLFGEGAGNFAGVMGGLAISPKAIKGMSKLNQAVGLKSGAAKGAAKLRGKLLDKISQPQIQSMLGGAVQAQPATWLQMSRDRGD